MRRFRPIFGLIGFLASLCGAATLAPTSLQSGLAQAQEQFEQFRIQSPNLAAVLTGKPSQAEKLQLELFQVPVSDSVSLAMANAAQGLLNEKTAVGSGASYIHLSVQNARNLLGLQWLLALLQLQNGTTSSFQAQAQGLEASMLEQGWTRLPEASSWLLATARDMQSQGQTERAKAAREIASKLDPVSPVPEITLFFQSLRDQEWGKGYSHLESAALRVATYSINQEVIAFNTLRLIRYALALTCLLLLLSWVVRYWPFVVHGYAELLPRDTNLYLRYGILALIPVALLVAGVGLLAMCFLTAFVLWRRAKPYERTMIAAILIFVGSQQWLAGLETTISSRFDQSGPEAIFQRSIEEGWSEELGERLDHSLSRATSSEKPILLAAQSILQRKKGLYQDAILSARQAKLLDPGDPRIVQNLGNAFFLVERYDSASLIYHSLLGQSWNNGPLLYNLGQAIARKGRTDSMGALIGKATTTARYHIDVVADQNTRSFRSLPPNRNVIDPEPPAEFTWARILDDYKSQRWTVDRWDLQTGMLDIPPSMLSLSVIGLLLFLIWWGSRQEKRKVLFECRTCGRIMCRHCRKGIHCSNCFRRLSGIEEVDLRNQLLDRIDHESNGRRRILRLTMDLALPGTGRLMAEPSFRAFIQVFVLGACLAYSLNLSNVLTLYPTADTLVGQSVAAGILVFLYALGGYQLIRGLGGDASHALKEA
ncbi:MAG: hypothetical protein IPK50_20445 [Fibrobacterota bacterium]|nr:hypothetical protein [Fibrobacterota bacterium]QQS04626.1 MAG: hypothetical protein IPK50_20445 [Fibrobacterota bacterium]